MSDSLGDKMLESYRTRKAYQLNWKEIKLYISEGLSENSRTILKKSEIAMQKKTSERSEDEKELLRLRNTILQKINRIFKRLECDIYGPAGPKCTEAGKNPMYFLFYIFYF